MTHQFLGERSMGAATSLLVHSKYFLPIFNMAIFDGPFRLYFAQDQEAEALRLYFELHEILGDRIRPPRAGSVNSKALFVLLYPDHDTYSNAFASRDEATDTWLGDNRVIGIKGPNWTQEALQHILSRIDEVFDGPMADRPQEISVL